MAIGVSVSPLLLVRAAIAQIIEELVTWRRGGRLDTAKTEKEKGIQQASLLIMASLFRSEEQVRILVYSKDHPTEFGSHGFTFEFLPNYRTKKGEQIPIQSYIKAGCGDVLVFRFIRKGNRDKNWRELEIEENYIICNPRTMQCVWLPPVPCGIGCSTEVALVCDPFYSFDTHHSRCCLQDSYRYRVFSISTCERGLERPKLNVFDSETRQWVKLVVSGPQGGLRL
ncbi:hypothetical protein Cgig2_015286 [Carnegiea gigantea]|uniref:Uncharacterized protein n=1 Tax=Carnegiea gigantea TaxID=171969 RepID=A0A9Q1QE32_9CARY|nr:hypothetical protein Cgig2_015286 [Carnegiea gigantea]